MRSSYNLPLPCFDTHAPKWYWIIFTSNEINKNTHSSKLNKDTFFKNLHLLKEWRNSKRSQKNTTNQNLKLWNACWAGILTEIWRFKLLNPEPKMPFNPPSRVQVLIHENNKAKVLIHENYKFKVLTSKNRVQIYRRFIFLIPRRLVFSFNLLLLSTFNISMPEIVV
jgi:hypothetical protein